MASKNRTHFGFGESAMTHGLVPRRLVRQEFGRRIYRLMIERSWRQSDLARATDLPRDSISRYINGQSLPTAQSLANIAKAFDMEPEALLPNIVEDAINEDTPSLDFRVSTSDSTRGWLRLNRLITVETFAKVMVLLNADDAVGK